MNSAQMNYKGSLPFGLTTCRKVRKGRLLCAIGSSRKHGPWHAEPRLTKLAAGTWNVTTLVGKEPELVPEVERYRLDKVVLDHNTVSALKPVFLREG